MKFIYIPIVIFLVLTINGFILKALSGWGFAKLMSDIFLFPLNYLLGLF